MLDYSYILCLTVPFVRSFLEPAAPPALFARPARIAPVAQASPRHPLRGRLGGERAARRACSRACAARGRADGQQHTVQRRPTAAAAVDTGQEGRSCYTFVKSGKLCGCLTKGPFFPSNFLKSFPFPCLLYGKIFCRNFWCQGLTICASHDESVS